MTLPTPWGNLLSEKVLLVFGRASRSCYLCPGCSPHAIDDIVSYPYHFCLNALGLIHLVLALQGHSWFDEFLEAAVSHSGGLLLFVPIVSSIQYTGPDFRTRRSRRATAAGVIPMIRPV